MRGFWLGFLGVICCIAQARADSFNELDALLASKDFPFPPDQSNLPENTPSTDDDDYTTTQNPPSGNTNKKVGPPTDQNKAKTGKDIFPPEESNLPTNKPKTGKDIFPPEESSAPLNSGKSNKSGIEADVNMKKPNMGKDIFPPTE